MFRDRPGNLALMAPFEILSEAIAGGAMGGQRGEFEGAGAELGVAPSRAIASSNSGGGGHVRFKSFRSRSPNCGLAMKMDQSETLKSTVETDNKSESVPDFDEVVIFTP